MRARFNHRKFCSCPVSATGKSCASTESQSVMSLPGVGKNLQDHLDFILAYKTKDTDNFGIGLTAGMRLIGHLLRWRKTGSSMASTPFAEGAAFLKTSPELDRPRHSAPFRHCAGR